MLAIAREGALLQKSDWLACEVCTAVYGFEHLPYILLSQVDRMRFFIFIVLALYVSVIYAVDDGQHYRIGPGDVISVVVFGEDDLSLKKVRVSTSGSISFALLGEVDVRDFTASELESEVVRRLKDGYLRNPVVTVSVLEYRLFYVNGEVKSPGGYSYVEGLTVQKAITLAGGLTGRASKEKITLLKEGKIKSAKNVDFSARVNPGDVINVDESFFFYVNGEVKKPGGYSYIDGLTVQKAITLAGGFTGRASKQKIKLEKESQPGVTKKAGLNTAVSAGDIITVGESFF